MHRISIVSRGMALGFTLIPPAKDKLHETKSHLLERIAVMMGGRAAELMFFNETTTGAANDFDQATSVARAMVVEYGMSTLGPVNFGPTYDVTDYGRSTWQDNQISQEYLSRIDKEIQKILNEGFTKAQDIVKTNKAALEKVGQALISKESLDQDEFEALIGGPKGKKVAAKSK